MEKAYEALRSAAADRHNKAAGLSRVLLAYACVCTGRKQPPLGELSAGIRGLRRYSAWRRRPLRMLRLGKGCAKILHGD